VAGLNPNRNQQETALRRRLAWLVPPVQTANQALLCGIVAFWAHELEQPRPVSLAGLAALAGLAFGLYPMSISPATCTIVGIALCKPIHCGGKR